MLCNVCQGFEYEIDTGEDGPYGRIQKHHSSYRDLYNSARAGCDFCTTIWQRDLDKKRRSPSNYVVSEPEIDNAEIRWADGEKLAKAEDVDDFWAKEPQINWGITSGIHQQGNERGKLWVSQRGFNEDLKEEFYFWVKTGTHLVSTWSLDL